MDDPDVNRFVYRQAGKVDLVYCFLTAFHANQILLTA